ncbi:hypothetical protein, partial [uncultured Thiodictyon sp.]|uniref:hypothetical protein n=1 Tax=uncultured Thiodictyon sp. TaxID=1846217 RepID=UPI0025D9C635
IVVGLFDYDNDNDNDSVPGISVTTSVLIAPALPVPSDGTGHVSPARLVGPRVNPPGSARP